jgi:6-phosphogluconolactonase (cycloisomerase 2 family)
MEDNRRGDHEQTSKQTTKQAIPRAFILWDIQNLIVLNKNAASIIFFFTRKGHEATLSLLNTHHCSDFQN